jgi:hypothetical protein
MTHESLTNEDWDWAVEELGGASLIATTARETKAFLRPREVRSAVDLLRLTLAYCLGQVGLRTTVAWAEAVGVASLSDVALLGRLRNTGDWLFASDRPSSGLGLSEGGAGACDPYS